MSFHVGVFTCLSTGEEKRITCYLSTFVQGELCLHVRRVTVREKRDVRTAVCMQLIVTLE